MATDYVDCDGHVMEKVDEIAALIGKVNGIEGEINSRRMVPSLDRFHTPRLQRRTPGTFDPAIGPERWMEFLDKTGAVVSTETTTVGPVGAKKTEKFKITSAKGGVYGYRYKPLT